MKYYCHRVFAWLWDQIFDSGLQGLDVAESVEFNVCESCKPEDNVRSAVAGGSQITLKGFLGDSDWIIVFYLSYDYLPHKEINTWRWNISLSWNDLIMWEESETYLRQWSVIQFSVKCLTNPNQVFRATVLWHYIALLCDCVSVGFEPFGEHAVNASWVAVQVWNKQSRSTVSCTYCFFTLT